jgi:hypothetical protein
VSDARPELGAHFDAPVHALLVPGEQPESAAEAHGRMVEAAKAAGYDVGAAIPLAPREATPSAPELRSSDTAHALASTNRSQVLVVVVAGLVAALVLALIWRVLG